MSSPQLPENFSRDFNQLSSRVAALERTINAASLKANVLQNGVVNAGDLAISGISINGSTGAITCAIAAATISPCWINGGSGVLVPVYAQAQSVTLAPSSLPPSGSTSVIGIRIDTSGTISAPNVSTGAGNLAITSGSLSLGNQSGGGFLGLANISIFNNSGTYQLSSTTTLTQGTNWIDRRPWARGFDNYRANPSATNYTMSTTTLTAVSAADLSLRIESTGVPVLAVCKCSLVSSDTVGTVVGFSWLVDGAAGTTGLFGGVKVGYNFDVANKGRAMIWYSPLLLPAGSHLVQPAWKVDIGAGNVTIDNGYASEAGTVFLLQERVRQNANNGIV